MATGMSPEDIKKHLAALQSKMKPMGAPMQAQTEQPKKKAPPKKEVLPTPEQVIAAAGPPPFEPEPVGVAPCFSGCFKSLITNLGIGFVGSSGGKGMLMEVLSAVPECPVGK